MNSISLPVPPAHTGALHGITRKQVSIERLPARRQNSEPHAVPKKRGPKTDVLEALLKRVDGLEAKLKEKSTEGEASRIAESTIAEADEAEEIDDAEPVPKRLAIEASKSFDEDGLKMATGLEPITSRDNPASPMETNAYLHTYFVRFHGKPFYILDESSIRERVRLNRLPDSVAYAIWSVASRHTTHPRGLQAAVQLSEEYAQRARRLLDTDDPSVDCLQALLLLVMAFMASGNHKKAYMLMTSAIGMAMALELHREIDAHTHVTPVERSLAVDGEFFQQTSNLQYCHGSGKKSQGSTGMLIDITRILGITNSYLAAGGVKGDSHFPWHSLSTPSKIRQELDFWASGAGSVFSGSQPLFQEAEATIVFLSKLIYHLIHCLVYRPFLPIDLAELAGNGQHQSWQIEATNMCFLHANAIGELVDLARHAGTVEWPAIVGYCICTAATVHIHGAHYSNPSAYGGDVNVFIASPDLLSREMQHLSDLHFAWANIQHQSDTLQKIYNAHGELAKAVASSMRYTPGFHLEDFFDRYSNIGGIRGELYRFDPAHLSMSDVVIGFIAGRHSESPAARDTEGHGHKRKITASHKTRNNAMNETSYDQALSVGEATNAGTVPYQMNVNQSSSNIAAGPIQASVSRPSDLYVRSSGTQFEAAPRIHGYNIPADNPNNDPSHGMMPMGGTGFAPAYDYATGLSVANNQNGMNDGNSSFDPVFGALPTNRAAGWQGEDGQQRVEMNTSTSGLTPSPGTKSASGSTSTGHSEEKDPFLSLLEQLAEDEKHFNGGAADLEFFLAGSNNV
ncbi:hypothetical protein ED733_003015 [Metarhizium rileyi]|uniref:Xylanolytic transcriptional activator regulatory domain-containing protein n=1 Tax=Metarhizium rileyi (strain RCEF 4871) TaxID=1649241 RepID=A0A5C6G1Q6_METRR|nr:hypothetical protein ED733_003015 [Metarhizium rileyi]